MVTEGKQSLLIENVSVNKSIGLKEKFEIFCKELEDYRILLLSAMLLIQGCILVPVTILVTSFIDLDLGGIAIVFLALGTFGILVTNMAEASIKTILITFVLSLTSSIVMIAIHLLSISQ